MTPLPPVKKVGDSFSCCGQLWSPRALMNHADNAHAGGDLVADEVFIEIVLDLMVEDGDAEKVEGGYRPTEIGLKRVRELAAKAGIEPVPDVLVVGDVAVRFTPCSPVAPPGPKVKVKDAEDLTPITMPPGQVDGRRPGAEGFVMAIQNGLAVVAHGVTRLEGEGIRGIHSEAYVYYPEADLWWCPCPMCMALLEQLRGSPT